MAATDQSYRNQKTLDVVFGVSCLLLLGSTVWMFVQDYNRDFKAVQRTFRDVETALAERDMVRKLPDPDAFVEKQEAVVEARQALKEATKKVQPAEQEIMARREAANLNVTPAAPAVRPTIILNADGPPPSELTPNFSGVTWDRERGVWVVWRNGLPVAFWSGVQ